MIDLTLPWQVITGDCLDVMKGIPDGVIDAVITDPPYGIGAAKMNLGMWQSSRMPKAGWDDVPLSPQAIAALLGIAPKVIIWGGNYMGLPPTRGFLVWDKGNGFKGRSFSECEYAWTNLDRPARIFRRDPLASGDYKNRVHKTQKPIPLMEWCIKQATKPGDLVIDPYCGSGATGEACIQTDRRFIGIEINPSDADIAHERCAKAWEQARQLKLEGTGRDALSPLKRGSFLGNALPNGTR
jgi:DNA modification methylase